MELTLAFTNHLGEIQLCDLVFEEDVPYAVWAECPEKERWIKLSKEHLQPVNNFMAGEFVHFLLTKPINTQYKPS